MGGIGLNSQDKHLLMEQWYRQYAPFLFHYARQLTNHHSAEEAVQETFRIAWEAVQQQEIEYPKTWLRKITENVLKNQLRQHERRTSLLAGTDGLPADTFGKCEDPVDVELEYDGLISRQDLHLLKRLAVDGCTYAEAAQELGTTAEACRKRASRARQVLRKLLED